MPTAVTSAGKRSQYARLLIALHGHNGRSFCHIIFNNFSLALTSVLAISHTNLLHVQRMLLHS
jgi:hypothetical protein